MNTQNKVYLGIIIVLAIIVTVLAAVGFQVSNKGQKHIEDLQARIELATDNIDTIIKEIPEVEGVLRQYYAERGRVWDDCEVDRLEEQTLPPKLQQVVARIVITQPLLANESGVPTTVAPPDTLRGIVYAFETNETDGVVEKGNFLGRFSVSTEPPVRQPFEREGHQLEGFRVTLATVDPLSDEDIEKIFAAGQSRWALHASPPIDRIAGIFDKLSADEIDKLAGITDEMSPDEKDEKRQQFQEATQPRANAAWSDEEIAGQIEKMKEWLDEPGGDENEKEDYRQVVAHWEQSRSDVNTALQKVRGGLDEPESEAARGFAIALVSNYQRRASTLRKIEIAETDYGILKDNEEKAKEEIDKLENEDIPREEKRLEAMNAQRDAVEELLELYEKENQHMELQIEKFEAQAQAFLQKITEYQLQIAQLIESKIEAAGNDGQSSEIRR